MSTFSFVLKGVDIVRNKKRMSKKERRKLKRQLKSFLNDFKEENNNNNILLNVEASNKISTVVLVNKIFEFCQLYSGILFYPYQEQFSKRIIRSVLENDGEEITALFSRQSGKQTI